MTRDPHSPDCGREGSYRDTITRPLTDLSVAGYPLVPRVASPRYRCTTPQCGRAVFNQDLANVDQYLVVNQLAHQLIDGSSLIPDADKRWDARRHADMTHHLTSSLKENQS